MSGYMGCMELDNGNARFKAKRLTTGTVTVDTNIKYQTFTQAIWDWTHGTNIQHAFPQLSADHRELLLTGILPDEWDEIFMEVE